MRWRSKPILTSMAATAAALTITVPAKATVYLSTEQAQQTMFPGARFTPVPLQLNDAQREAMYERSGVREPFKANRVWRASNGGFFVVDEVLGKHEKIKYAVAINPNGSVRQIEILEYNESYGYEVRDASWRRQFVGKSADSTLKLNEDIQNISGATLSSKHVTDGVKRVLVLYEVALKDAS